MALLIPLIRNSVRRFTFSLIELKTDNKQSISSIYTMASKQSQSNPDVDVITDDQPMAQDKKPASDKLSVVNEGKASILYPSSVFYNPVQEFNRDLTIAVISQFAKEHIQEVQSKRQRKQELVEGTAEVVSGDAEKPIAGMLYDDGVRILEGLAASGLRSMRFGLEIPGVKKIIANDYDQGAVEVIKKNIERNNLGGLVEASCNDVAMLMYQNKAYQNRFDVIDLDPYGTAAPFLDSAVQAVRDGGLLCVTCTDAATLCGNNGEKCFTLYGSMPLKGKFRHEMGLRIILRAIELHANRYQRYIVPLLSLSVDFYFRVFVRVYIGQYQAKFAASRTGMVYECSGCGMFETQTLCTVHPAKGDRVKFVPSIGPPVGEKCEHCGHKHHIGGPIYLGKLHDTQFIDEILGLVNVEPKRFSTSRRIEGLLTIAQEELTVPLYQEIDHLYNVVHCMPFKMMDFRSAILNAGYQVTYSHACRNSLKTNAPNSVLWDIVRAYLADKPHSNKLTSATPGYAILSKKPSIEVSFTKHPDCVPKSVLQNMVRWQQNPERDWGPKPRAKKLTDDDTLENRRLLNQGKRKRKAQHSLAEDGIPTKQQSDVLSCTGGSDSTGQT